MSPALETASGGRTPFRHSLRWRLPLYFGAPMVVLLIAFLWAMQRQLESAMIDSGRERAQLAAEQVAELLARSLRNAIDRNEELASRRAFVDLLAAPNAATRAPALALLDSLDGDRRFELWDANGSLVLESAAPGSTEAGPAEAALAEQSPPTRAGVSGLHAGDDEKVFAIVSEVRGGDSAGAPVLGRLRRYGRVSAEEEQALAGLVGSQARLELESIERGDGSPGGGPAETDAGAAGSAVSDVGARARVALAPWAVHVSFPRPALVEPARTFVGRMAVIALLFAAVGIALMLLLGVRLTRPLHALAGAAEEIAAGDYSRRVASELRRDEIGRLAAAFNTMSDSVEEAHGRLQETHDHTQFALAAAHIGVWSVDLATRRMSCSESMRAVHGLPSMDLPDTLSSFLEFVHPEDRDAMATLLSGSWGEDEVLDVGYRTTAADGSVHWIEAKGRVENTTGGRPVSVTGVSIDVTDRRRLETQFLQAQKMEAVGQLAGGVAHDFNNLLTSILGHGNLMLSELPEEHPLREDVIEVLRSGESGARLTRQLLAFSRKQVARQEVIVLDAIVRNTEKLLRRLIGEHIQLVTRLAPDLEAVRADQGQMEQVLVNLAVNARDGMPGGGGTLTIETANVDLTHAYAREHVGVTPGRYVLLSVSDTGIGMDTETQEHIFEPFFTTKAPDKGTGLGLATVFGIVKQSNGHIYLYSEPGRGSTFKIYLPVAGERPRHAPLATPSEVVGGTETILLVEDNASVRRVAKTVLTRIGYRVIEAGSGDEALALIEQNGAPDLLLTDVIMPGMTGPELVRRITEEHGASRFLFTSGYSGDALGQQGLDDPGTLFIEKPYSPVALARKVRAALDAPPPAPRD